MRHSVPFSLLVLAAAATLAGCVEAPSRPPGRAYQRVPPAPPEPVAEVIAYPAKGQTAEQLDRDRYECHGWAVRQTGFDPSLPGTPPRERVRVVQGPPPGAAVAGGAVTGAVLGAVVARPGDEGAGAIIGGIAGAAIGAVAESSRAEATQQVDEQEARRQAAANGGRSRQGGGAYRRAISACLEGRGYSVK